MPALSELLAHLAEAALVLLIAVVALILSGALAAGGVAAFQFIRALIAAAAGG